MKTINYLIHQIKTQPGDSLNKYLRLKRPALLSPPREYVESPSESASASASIGSSSCLTLGSLRKHPVQWSPGCKDKMKPNVRIQYMSPADQMAVLFSYLQDNDCQAMQMAVLWVRLWCHLLKD